MIADHYLVCLTFIFSPYYLEIYILIRNFAADTETEMNH